MADEINRRQFLGKSVVGSAALSSLLSLEEAALLHAKQGAPSPKVADISVQVGKIGEVSVSRIICGGNLIGGFAHSRDLIYVSSLLKQYFTDEKIIETLEICEQCGINTIIAGTTSVPVLTKYWNERGGKIQWLAQCVAKTDDIAGDAQAAIDAGATGVLLLGNIADEWSRSGKADLIGRFVDFAKGNGVIAGVAGHNLGTPMACEKAGIDADFYMKTLHSTKYWSSRRPGQDKDVIDNYAIDNYWDKDPAKTIEFMSKVTKPWIAYKVLAAGAIHPRDGFKFAFENGADFACVGMFDFQVREDAIIASNILSSVLSRSRPWRA